jgi:hypothetical protein
MHKLTKEQPSWSMENCTSVVSHEQERYARAIPSSTELRSIARSIVKTKEQPLRRPVYPNEYDLSATHGLEGSLDHHLGQLGAELRRLRPLEVPEDERESKAVNPVTSRPANSRSKRK